jgi:hypothetical protein
VTRLATALDVLSATLAGAALAAACVGPLGFEWLDTPLSIRTLWRPIGGAVLLLALRVWLVRGVLRAELAGLLSRASLGSILAAGAVGWFAFLSPTCGGADSYGYVSAADRLLAGEIVQREVLAEAMPFADGIAAACPLGYVPSGRVADSSVPAYPLGLSGLMAAARFSLGRTGPFVVAPLMGLVLLWSTYRAAHAWSGDREPALAAAALTATNPVVFTYSIQPMSDVPAAALTMTAVALLAGPPPRPFAAGIAAGAAVLIRPALAPAEIALAALAWMAGSEGRAARRGVAWYLAPVMAAGLTQASIQSYLYGDPLVTGYGTMDILFSSEHVAANAVSYAYWTTRALGPAWLGALAIGLVAGERRLRATTLLLAAAVVPPYLVYRPYDHWETLRFLMPVIVVATIAAAAGLVAVARRVAAAQVRGALIVALSGGLAWGWASWLSTHQVFSLPAHEARYRLAGEWIARTTPAGAVVLALQHGGSLRYYGARQTINWERIPTGSFDATVRALRARGHPVFLLLDSQEERAILDARHPTALGSGRWLPVGQVRDMQLHEAR